MDELQKLERKVEEAAGSIGWDSELSHPHRATLQLTCRMMFEALKILKSLEEKDGSTRDTG